MKTIKETKDKIHFTDMFRKYSCQYMELFNVCLEWSSTPTHKHDGMTI